VESVRIKVSAGVLNPNSPDDDSTLVATPLLNRQKELHCSLERLVSIRRRLQISGQTFHQQSTRNGSQGCATRGPDCPLSGAGPFGRCERLWRRPVVDAAHGGHVYAQQVHRMVRRALATPTPMHTLFFRIHEHRLYRASAVGFCACVPAFVALRWIGGDTSGIG
jgi:hypothetical protein